MNADWTVSRSSLEDLSSYFGDGIKFQAEGWHLVGPDVILVTRNETSSWRACVWNSRDPRSEWRAMLDLPERKIEVKIVKA